MDVDKLQGKYPPDAVSEFEATITQNLIPDNADNPDDDTNVGYHHRYFPIVQGLAADVFEFLIERLRVQLRAEGARHDVLAAVLGSGDDDLNRLLARAEALRDFLATPEGADLLAAYRRAANILRIEEKKDGPHPEGAEDRLLVAPAERALAEALAQAGPAASSALGREDFAAAMAALAALKPPVDAFFDGVTVNDSDPAKRAARLALLARFRDAVHGVADFSKIEG